MKRIDITILLVLIGALGFAQTHSHQESEWPGIPDHLNPNSTISRMADMSVEEYTGRQWQVLGESDKIRIVDGFLAGFSVWRDYLFDLDPTIYQRYEEYDRFLRQSNVAAKIVADLDRYYVLNRENFKFNDRVTNMIVVFYGKYWWEDFE